MQHSLKFTLAFTAAALAGLLAYGYSDSGSAGILLAHAHTWKWDSRDISAGASIPQTAILTGSESSELMVKCPEDEVISYSCKQAPCHVHLCSQQSDDVEVHRIKPPEPSFVEALLAKLTRAENANVTTAVRGEVNPNDAVVLQKGDEIHLAPALNRLLEGDYCFSLQSLERSGATPITFRLAWSKDDEPEGIAKLPGLQPGSYTLEKKIPEGPSACSADPKAVPAWILIAPESQFADLTAKWKSNRNWFDDLAASGNSPAVVATMRHATIAGLSQSVKR